MKKKRHSKQYWAALAITILGVVDINFSLIKSMFGEYSGVSYILISIVIVVLRQYTTQPIEPIISRKKDA